METAQTGETEQMIVTRLGRFVTERPVSYRWAGGQHVIRKVIIQSQPWPKGLSPSEASSQRWDSTMATLRARDFGGEADINDVVVEERPLAPEAHAVLYHRGYTPEDLMWHALLPTKEAGVTFQKNSWDGDVEADFETLRMVVNAYRPGAPAEDDTAWFHARKGGVALPFRDSESLTARFEDQEAELTLSFSTINEEPEASLWERVLNGAWKAAAGTVGLRVNMIRDRERTVAGRSGKEEVLTYTEDGSSHVKFWWFYPGKPHSGTHPRIEIEMNAKEEQMNVKMEHWDRLLDAMQLISSNK